MKKGITYIIISAFCFACMNVFVRLSGDLPSIQKSFFRNLVALLFAAYILYKDKIPFRVGKGNMKHMILRSTAGTLGILCNFYAVDHLAVADASILNKLSPFFAIVFSLFILNEKIKPVQICCLILAFTGCLFITRPGFDNVNALPALIGVLGGMGAGLAYTYVRVLGNHNVPGPLIVCFFSGFSCVVTLIPILLDYAPMTWRQFGFLILAGLSAAGGQFAITAAYTHAPAREISIFDYSQILFATMLGFFVFGEIPVIYSFIGYGLIILASLLMFLYNKRQHEQAV